MKEVGEEYYMLCHNVEGHQPETAMAAATEIS